MKKMTYSEAYHSALKYNFQNFIHSHKSPGPLSHITLGSYYKTAERLAAEYVFNMKSEDLTSIPVW